MGVNKKFPMEGIDLSDDSIRQIYDAAVKNFDHGVFVELGSLYGGSTIYLAQKIQESKKNIEVYAIDTWKNIWKSGVEENIFRVFWRNVVRNGVDDIIVPICLDSAAAACGFPNNSVDFVFVDADHSYEGCKKDILAWLPKLRWPGWIGGHDFTEDVVKVVDDIFYKMPKIYDQGCRSFLIKDVDEYRVKL